MRTALSVLLMCIACAPLPKSEPVVPARSNQPGIEDAIRTAQSTFDSAAQAGDPHRMAGLFDDDAELITPASDTIRGRSAIERLMAAAQPGATGAKFWFAREPPLEHCRDGGYEHAQLTVEIRQGDGSQDTLRARFVVLWNRDSLGSARVKRVSFPERELSRWPTRAECVTDIERAMENARKLQESSRFSISLFAGHTTGDPSRDLEFAMKSRGWSDVAYTCPSSRPCDNRSTQSYRSSTNPIVPQLRYRFSRRLAMEMLGGVLIRGATIGVDTAAGSQMELSWSGACAGMLLSYQLAGLELGMGPAVQTVHWRSDDRNWPYNASTFYESSYHTKTVGLIGDIGWKLQLPSRLHVDVHGESRRFARTDVRGSPRFPTVNVRSSSTFLGLGLGWAF